MAALADWVEPDNTQRFSRDPDDDKFVHAALAAQAEWLISGDRDLLDVHAVQGLTMRSPAVALRLLTEMGPGPPSA
jgi:predicted nucleic acid-binding protein